MESRFAIAFVLLAGYLVNAQEARNQRSRTEDQSSSLHLNTPSSGWEHWSNWTPCSRSCGGGVREKTRNCRVRMTEDSPPRNCSGSAKAYQPCNYHLCPDGRVSTRKSQCAKYNRKPFAGSTYIWDPFSASGPCVLNCKARGSRFFIRHALSHTDGNDCSYFVLGRRGRRSRRGQVPKYVCITGKCKVVGCDGTIGSGLVMDQCGVCGGNGETCDVVEGRFRTPNLNHDFHRVVTLPVGATKINITESSNSRSYLALRSANPDGSFYINGGIVRGTPDRSNSYRVAGTVFRYDRPYQTEKGETFLADGPTEEALDILLYFQGTNPGIIFQYTIPRSPPPSQPEVTHPRRRLNHNRHETLDQQPQLNIQPPRSPSGRWVSGGTGYNLQPGEASHSTFGSRFFHAPNRFRPNHRNTPSYVHPPGFGMRQNPSNSRRRMSGNSGHYPSYWSNSNADLSSFESEPESDSSNTRREAILVNRQDPETIGETVWRTRGFGPCSRSCAEGIRTTIVLCVKVRTNEKVNPRFCSGRRPKIKVRRCNRQACPAFYRTEEWSDCTKSCGFGSRTRTVRCMQKFAGNFTTAVSHRRCRSLTRPRAHERCKVQDCARWVVSDEWSKCNTRCGTGTQRRHATCQAGDGSILPDDSCSASRRPDNVRSCDAGPCVTRWYVTAWEECSADCDRGVQRRHVFCLNTREAAAGCPSRFEPNSTRTCARSSCGIKYEWFAGEWGSCSSKCGSGIQERKLVCMSVDPQGSMNIATPIDDDVPCDATKKPATQRQCNTQSCGSRWHYTPWTSCSVSCGGGSRTRDVQCLDSAGEISSLCNRDRRPRETERCNTVSCLALQVSEPGCEDRLKRCHVILQARLCNYPYYRENCCATCTQASASQRNQRP